MRINEIIRKYRKEQNLTQEQVANYLGVTAPAVNKWENGISYPDIVLLAPLARLLKIDLNTLLSFKEELSDGEINQFIRQISMGISKDGYKKTFEKASEKIKEYPNCDKLILFLAQILNGYLVIEPGEKSEKEKYEKQILAWFESVVFSDDREIANMATASLSQNYINNGQFEEAQKLLDRVPKMGFDKRIFQANLYTKQGNYEKAYEIHESMIYQYANTITNSLMQIITLLCEEEKYNEALEYATLVSTVADNFSLGKYIGAASKSVIYMKLKDEEKAIESIENMVKAIDSIKLTKSSSLYSHMKFKEDSSIDEMKKMIFKSLQTDKEVDFIRDNPKFKKILNELE